MTPSLTELATSSANDPQPSSGGNFDEYEPYDVSDHPFVKRHPTTAIGGTAVALRYFPDQDEPDRGYAGLVVKDPFLGEAGGRTRVAVRDDDERSKGDDIKIVDLDDKATKAMPGNVGVEFDSRSFYSETFEEWPDNETIQDLLNDDDIIGDEPVLKLTGGSGRSAIRTLDVHGRGNFGVVKENGDPVLNDNGYPILNDSLIETHSDWYDSDVDDAPRPRFGPAQTELRPDVEETRVLVLLNRQADIMEDYDGDAYWETVFAELDDERRQELAETYAENFNNGTGDDEPDKTADDYLTTVDIDGEEVEMVKLQPTADFERSEAIKRDQNTWCEWGYPSREELNELREENGFDPLDD